MWKFDSTGNLRNQGITLQKYLTNLMLRRGVLTADDTIFRSGSVQVTGRARSFIRIKEVDSTAVDSLDFDEFNF
jgi:hypothetical protein